MIRSAQPQEYSERLIERVRALGLGDNKQFQRRLLAVMQGNGLGAGP